MKTTSRWKLFGGVALFGMPFLALGWAAPASDAGLQECTGDPGLYGAKTIVRVTIDDRREEGPWAFLLDAQAYHYSTRSANHQVDLSVGITGDISYWGHASNSHSNCSRRYIGKTLHETWVIDREASYCAQGVGIHSANTDDDWDEDGSASYRVCGTVKPPPGGGECEGPPDQCFLVPH